MARSVENSVYHLFRWLDILCEVVTHLRHLSMAVLTHQAAVGHGATHALGALAGMTEIAGLLQDGLGKHRVTSITLIINRWRHILE